MKQIDRYYNFLISAISAPVEGSEFYYFYDYEYHKLIRTNSNLENKDGKLIQLPRLETKTKKEFLTDFANNQKNEIKEYLLKSIDKLDGKSKMNLQQSLKKFGIVAAKLDLLSGQFLIKSAEKKYRKFNLSKNMVIDFIH